MHVPRTVNKGDGTAQQHLHVVIHRVKLQNLELHGCSMEDWQDKELYMKLQEICNDVQIGQYCQFPKQLCRMQGQHTNPFLLQAHFAKGLTPLTIQQHAPCTSPPPFPFCCRLNRLKRESIVSRDTVELLVLLSYEPSVFSLNR